MPVDFIAAKRHIARMRRMFLLGLLALGACSGDALPADQFGNQVTAERSDTEPMQRGAVPVRVGELGPNFAACSAAGTTRHLDAAAGEALPVRPAPFETTDESARIPAGARFFICSRTHDQRWLGIVYDESGTLSPACAVSRPITARRNYQGPCRSGWVPSAFVKVIAG